MLIPAGSASYNSTRCFFFSLKIRKFDFDSLKFGFNLNFGHILAIFGTKAE